MVLIGHVWIRVENVLEVRIAHIRIVDVGGDQLVINDLSGPLKSIDILTILNLIIIPKLTINCGIQAILLIHHQIQN